MQTIKIKEKQLREIIEQAMDEACKAKGDRGFPFSGWGIPVMLHEDGSMKTGSWMSDNTYFQPGFPIELCRVDAWTPTDGYVSEDELDENYTYEDASWDYIHDGGIDQYINVIERNIEVQNDPFDAYIEQSYCNSGVKIKIIE